MSTGVIDTAEQHWTLNNSGHCLNVRNLATPASFYTLKLFSDKFQKPKISRHCPFKQGDRPGMVAGKGFWQLAKQAKGS